RPLAQHRVRCDTHVRVLPWRAACGKAIVPRLHFDDLARIDLSSGPPARPDAAGELRCAVRRPGSAAGAGASMNYSAGVSVPPGRRTRWKDRADDPELERELIEELDRRRRGREEDRERRALERRSRWLIWLFVLLTVAAAAAIGYGPVEVARAVFG